MRFLNLHSHEIRDILVDGLGVSQQIAFNFWLQRINEICRADSSPHRQIQYTAEILTEFSQAPPNLHGSSLPIPEFVHLAELNSSDQLIGHPLPPKEFENAGRYFLFLSGFEEQHVLKILGLGQTIQVGSVLFKIAGKMTHDDLLLEMSEHFKDWQRRLAYLHYELTKTADQTLGTKLIISTPKI